MSTYIKLFETTAQYTEYMGGEPYLPNVSLCKDAPTVMHYTPVPDPYNGHDYVDLGLPSGTKWATMNVGASSPEGYGKYFAWAETENKSKYNWSTYKYSDNGSSSVFTKYNTTDGKTVLDTEDDAASVNMGGQWHTPTREQFNELLNTTYVTRTWVTNYQGTYKNGMLFTSVADNTKTLFLPAAGVYSGGSTYENGQKGNYWTREYKSAEISYYVTTSGGDNAAHEGTRWTGYTVRGVVG